MKSEKAIRRLISLIEKQMVSPCNCKGTEHEMECVAGCVAMRTQSIGLRWVLGEVTDAEIYGPLTPPWDLERN